MFWLILLAVIAVISLIIALIDEGYIDGPFGITGIVSGALFVLLLFGVLVVNSNDQLATITAKYEDLVGRLNAAEEVYITQDEAATLRKAVSDFNKNIVYAKRMYKSFFVGLFIDKDLENFELLDYKKIKFKSNYVIQITDQ